MEELKARPCSGSYLRANYRDTQKIAPRVEFIAISASVISPFPLPPSRRPGSPISLPFLIAFPPSPRASVSQPRSRRRVKKRGAAPSPG